MFQQQRKKDARTPPPTNEHHLRFLKTSCVRRSISLDLKKRRSQSATTMRQRENAGGILRENWSEDD
jgi:hypothetical protein